LPGGLSLPLSARHSKQASQQAADAFYEAAQQSEDAGKQATYGASEAA
jgi:hypothetical protein